MAGQVWPQGAQYLLVALQLPPQAPCLAAERAASLAQRAGEGRGAGDAVQGVADASQPAFVSTSQAALPGVQDEGGKVSVPRLGCGNDSANSRRHAVLGQQVTPRPRRLPDLEITEDSSRSSVGTHLCWCLSHTLFPTLMTVGSG